jgi:WD domain, G-beta repeat
MAPPQYVVGVATTRPSTTPTPGGGGGGLTLLDPRTGSFLSSLRAGADLSGKTAMGISSFSTFPPSPLSVASSTVPAIAYGVNSSKRGDAYAMLISVRNAPAPPILHWKCRLPEADMSAGLLVSKCGYYVVGGGASGCCYVWAAQGGHLLRTVSAHYRPCTCMAWSPCGRFLVTGGADGMVHVYSLMDLVDLATRNSKRTIPPLHTFSVHHFPVTCLTPLPSGRIASAAEDGQLLVMELCSQHVLLNIQFPHGVQCLAHFNGRIYAGSTEGTIYSVDLNAYAMHETEKQGATLAGKRRRQQGAGSATGFFTTEELVFGRRISTSANDEVQTNSTSDGGGPPVYQTDWVGHDHPVTSMGLLTDDRQPLLISGDSLGQVRIWDLHSRTCLNVLQPWSHGGTASNSGSSNHAGKPAASPATTSPAHPITSIQVIPQPFESASSGMFRAAAASGRNHGTISSLVTPLQKFAVAQQAEASGGDAAMTRVPFLRSNRTRENLEYWKAQPIVRKRRPQRREQHQLGEKPATEPTQAGGGGEAESRDHSGSEKVEAAMCEQIKSLQRELREKQSQIERWEKVNNKLMAKLQSKG